MQSQRTARKTDVVYLADRDIPKDPEPPASPSASPADHSR